MPASPRALCAAPAPILGVLAAIGLGTAAGFALFGTLAVVVGAAAFVFAFARRRRRARACAPTVEQLPVRVELTGTRTRT